MIENNRLAELFGLSQAQIYDHHKPQCENHLELNQPLRELKNDVGYGLFFDDTECHRR
jgi:hypothetical protein